MNKKLFPVIFLWSLVCMAESYIVPDEASKIINQLTEKLTIIMAQSPSEPKNFSDGIQALVHTLQKSSPNGKQLETLFDAIDNLDRAGSFAKDKETKAKITKTIDQVLTKLGESNIFPVDSGKGALFDPQQHAALMAVLPDESLTKKDAVLHTQQRGWIKRGSGQKPFLIRAAGVVVTSPSGSMSCRDFMKMMNLPAN